MKIKANLMDKEIRLMGRIMHWINPVFTERRLRFANKMTKRVKGRINDKSIQSSIEWITKEDGTKLRVCVYKPVDLKENVCGVLWFHGGGYAIGAPEMEVETVKKFIKASDCIFVVPDYRLSIEAPYPAALEDAYLSLLWMKNNAKAMMIKDNQLMVGGVSAGGGLAVALSLYARDKGEVSIAYQMPLYPMLDDRMTSESATNNNAPLWNSQSNAIAWRLYLGNLFKTDNVPIYAAPARATNVSGLPPAVTFVGELEPFKDETIEYVKNLRKAGIPAELMVYKGCFHGFDVVCPKAEISKSASAFLIRNFMYAVDHYYAPVNE